MYILQFKVAFNEFLCMISIKAKIKAYKKKKLSIYSRVIYDDFFLKFKYTQPLTAKENT